MKYFVDTENVGPRWLPLLKASQETDRFYVFVSEKSGPMTLPVPLTCLPALRRQVVPVSCQAGVKNAMDFQLVFELGFQASRSRKETYAIVSGDHGYDAILDACARKGIQVTRIDPNNGAFDGSREERQDPQPDQIPVPPRNAKFESRKKAIACRLSVVGVPEGFVDRMAEVLARCTFLERDRRQASCEAELEAVFGSERKEELYALCGDTIRNAVTVAP